ncbi:MAG: TIGR00341 family protein [Cyanobacteria bacterium P01_F01_bin.4]
MRERLEDFSNRYFNGRRVSPQGLKHMQDSLLDDSELSRDYIVLTIGACIIATLGLLSNSAAVIIGAMLIAPLMQPIRGLAFGILEGDLELIGESLKSLLIGTLISVALAASLGLALGFSEYGSEVWARSQPTLLDLGIAIAAGGISGFAKVQPRLSSTLAGTAIAVALMPPICVVGLGLAQWNLGLSWGSTLLYLTNLIGITLACMLAFLLTGYSPLKQARRPLGLVMAMVSILVIPLAVSLIQLVNQNRLEGILRDALLQETLTFRDQNVSLIHSETNWLTSPPEVKLTVYATEPITPNQVSLLEDFVERRMKRPFRLIFQFSRVEQVTNEEVQPAVEEGWTQPQLQNPQLQKPQKSPPE